MTMLAEWIKKAQPGLSYTGVPITKLSIGADVGLPVILLRGHQDGPTVYIGAAIHAIELNGIGIIFRILNSIHPTELRGKLLLVPVQNPVAFQHKQQFIPGDVYDSPQGNPYAAFPGSSTGQLSERTANAILEVAKHADYVVDLHTNGRGYDFIDHTFCFFSGGECADKARDLAKIFGTPLMTDAQSGPWTAGNMFHEWMNKKGTPTFGAELGQAGFIESDSVELGYSGMLNVLRYLGMMDGEITKNPNQVIVDKIIPVRAMEGGILKHSVELGTWVKEGDEIARVYDLHLREIERIKSPAAGIVHSQKTFLTVNGFERMALVGVPKG
jgi:predicted deacylase